MKKLLLTIILVGCGEQQTIPVSLPNVAVSGGEISRVTADQTVVAVKPIVETVKAPLIETIEAPIKETVITEIPVVSEAKPIPLEEPKVDKIVSVQACKAVRSAPIYAQFYSIGKITRWESGRIMLEVTINRGQDDKFANYMAYPNDLSVPTNFSIGDLGGLSGDFAVSVEKRGDIDYLIVNRVLYGRIISFNMPEPAPCETI